MTPIFEAGTAVAIGLVVGFEREHHGVSEDLGPKQVPSEVHPDSERKESPLGARTFALLALTGWVLAALDERWAAMLPVGLVAVAGLVTTQYVMLVRGGAQVGITTEAAAIAVLLLGALVRADRALAVSLALVIVLLLISKPWMRGAVVRLRRLEITATVQLLVLLALVLPMLPTEPQDPWGVIPPRKVGMFVALIAGLEYVGYVLYRLLGAQRGAALAGLVGGLASSTAVTAAMARQARDSRGMFAPAQLATFLANGVMAVRITVVAAILAPEVAWRVAVPMAAFAIVLLGGAIWRMRTDDGVTEPPRIELRNPFALIPALTWGAILCAVLLAAHFATEYLGQYGLILAAATSGLADVDAITLAAARQAGDGAIAVETAAIAITVAAASNTIVKAGLAIVGGGRAYGLRIALVFALGLAAAAAAVAVGLTIG